MVNCKNLTCIILSIFSSLTSGHLLATDPDYVAKVEKSMAIVISDHLGADATEFVKLFKYVAQLEQRSQAHKAKTPTDPLRLYRVVVGLIEEWKTIKIMLKDISSDLQVNRKDQSIQLPKKQDIEDVVTALFRIQDTYKLDTKDVAAGTVPGLNHNGSLTAQECYEIGMVAYGKSDFYHALAWLQEAGIRYENEEPPTINAPEILAPLSVALAEQENVGHAIRAALWLSDLLDSGEGEKQELFGKYPKVEQLIESNSHRKASIYKEELPTVLNLRDDYTTGDKIYLALCRGELPQKPIFTNPKLRCYYETSRPYLKLASAKVEVLNDSPPVIIFRGIINDKEIKTIQKLVRDKLQRSRVEGGDQKLYSPEQRASSTGYLSHTKRSVVDDIRKRVGVFTGLNMETAEEIQISRYAIGGHYGPHYDHATATAREKHSYHGSYDQLTGDRIATVMFYLSEPERGGATVFPYMNIAINATKGDAIFWYNLLKSGKDDRNAIHAGCPVVSGIKWIANQWIKEGGQEFRRLCGLNAAEESY